MNIQCSQDTGARTERGQGQRWKRLCLAASLEVDPAKLRERIDEARYAVIDRIVDRFSAKSSDAEQFELRVALEALRSLSGTEGWRDSE